MARDEFGRQIFNGKHEVWFSSGAEPGSSHDLDPADVYDEADRTGYSGYVESLDPCNECDAPAVVFLGEKSWCGNCAARVIREGRA